ncbi:hypothetical protein HNP84_002659 [Thermocatellispora tengchongensis]|uniref:Uncharacterized protein n=1 Tax=Thermocatellispora tengchongensis TaxID=1073253 RepID=A0A840NZM5_9ACTN|nr:hypothetical protein [Thermocatellispora tengchongensis]MBB5132938.1 hypothetical protein [Thermocatellispora tengchongensis]
MPKSPRPAAAHADGDRLKLHRHEVRADGRAYEMITLRPGVRARLSTNRYHDTWHILSDPHGARLLARLLWGLSYQRRPGTLVVIGPPHLTRNPFDAEPADPIALVPAQLTTLTRDAARALRRRVADRRHRPHGSVKWHTWGLEAEVARQEAVPWQWRRSLNRCGAAVERVGGMIVVRAAPDLLREWALDAAFLPRNLNRGTSNCDYHPQEVLTHYPDGEVQIFTDFRRRVSAASIARDEVLASLPDPPPPLDLNPLIWRRGTEVRARRGA